MSISTTSNSADFIGSLVYNVTTALGLAPSMIDAELYSDVVYINHVLSDYVTGQATSLDVGGYLMGDQATVAAYISREEWENGDWFLFGQKWLPWLAPPPNPLGNSAYVRRDRFGAGTRYNSARMAVLIPTLLSFAKITGIGVTGWYASKYLIRYIAEKA
jgi:hypothetical protein